VSASAAGNAPESTVPGCQSEAAPGEGRSGARGGKGPVCQDGGFGRRAVTGRAVRCTIGIWNPVRAKPRRPGSPPGPFGIRYPAATEYGAGLFLNPAAGDRAGLVLPDPAAAGHRPGVLLVRAAAAAGDGGDLLLDPAAAGDRAGLVLADPAAAEHRAPRPG
jgi:hypothetical protein